MKTLIEKLYKEDQIWFVLGSIISTDSLNSLADYEKAISLLDKFDYSIDHEEINIPMGDLIKISDYVKKSKELLTKESNHFKN